MLTKDLLKVKTQRGLILPQFINPKDSEAQDLARKLIESTKSSLGKTQSHLEETLNGIIEIENSSYAPGFVKILLDHIEFSESPEDLESQRWEEILSAQKLRQEQYFRSKEEFQESLGTLKEKSFEELAKKLYADLPEFRLMSQSVEWTELELIHRYNCGLVQSLLLLAPKVDVHLKFSSAVEKRNLFRAIKFHRLVVGNIQSGEGNLSFTIDGPLSLLVNTQAYGMRLANFFPRLVMAKHWQMDAVIRYKKRDYELSLSENDSLQSHYREWGDYRPEEFEDFLKSFNKSNSKWEAEWCDDLISLGGQNFCFPDITFAHPLQEKKIHLELFHRWHKGELEKRIQILQKHKESQVIIGVCNSLVKQDNMGSTLIQEQDFEKFGFIFRGVPTPKAVSALLDRTPGPREKK